MCYAKSGKYVFMRYMTDNNIGKLKTDETTKPCDKLVVVDDKIEILAECEFLREFFSV